MTSACLSVRLFVRVPINVSSIDSRVFIGLFGKLVDVCVHHTNPPDEVTDQIKDGRRSDIYLLFFLKGLAQAKIIKKSVILFWVPNMTI